jgi:hypothetical protein
MSVIDLPGSLFHKADNAISAKPNIEKILPVRFKTCALQNLSRLLKLYDDFLRYGGRVLTVVVP